MRLALDLSLGSYRNPTPAPQATPCAAIAALKRIKATHNRRSLTLEPHAVIRRPKSGKLLLIAKLVERNGKPVNGAEMNTYQLAKLSGVSLLEAAFTPDAGFDPNAPELRGKIVCSV